MSTGHPTITIDLVRASLLARARKETSLTTSAAQVLDRQQTKEVLRGVLHAVLFHRLFGTVRPRTFDVLDVAMVRCLLFLCSGCGVRRDYG